MPNNLATLQPCIRSTAAESDLGRFADRVISSGDAFPKLLSGIKTPHRHLVWRHNFALGPRFTPAEITKIYLAAVGGALYATTETPLDIGVFVTQALTGGRGRAFYGGGTADPEITLSSSTGYAPFFSSPLRDVAPDVESRLEELQALPAGWLDGDGDSPTSATLYRAREVLGQLIGIYGVPNPRLFATPEGGVQAEWSIGNREISIDFAPEGPMCALAVDTTSGDVTEAAPDASTDSLARLVLEGQ